ncbi:MAG: type II toxin-antitoxin system VapC family toxin [Spirochaetota bacterium]
MTILLDTHCWLWWLAAPEKLRAESLAALKDRANTVVVSSVVSWEIAIKHSIGRLQLPEPPDRFVPDRLARDGFTPLAVSHSHALRTAALPVLHKDPFDRLLIAQAQVENVPIMSANAVFSRYEVTVLPA